MTKFKIIAVAIALSIPSVAIAAAGCCTGMACCKDDADCCKDKGGKCCCDDMKKEATGRDASDPHAAHDMSKMGNK
ncbi:hypothetical protein ASE86_07730 [Sphingomonas sp. Leaf33]|uniref:hypothetical protein n=1 Tax=Sphingomonas sp. Leaf33 TaxID=1736215 RepID=UPI0006FC3D1D|nr:hypothetical protein [Sphingomonas sp. Leaf33]KQN26044.1 hypothetical protein ASE86_07730 [Sphingomonas sp. Leaf33]